MFECFRRLEQVREPPADAERASVHSPHGANGYIPATAVAMGIPLVMLCRFSTFVDGMARTMPADAVPFLHVPGCYGNDSCWLSNRTSGNPSLDVREGAGSQVLQPTAHINGLGLRLPEPRAGLAQHHHLLH